MRRKLSKTLGITGAVLLLLSALAYALFGEFPNDKPFKSDSHPEELVNILNKFPRVYGYGCDGKLTFYFKGDAKKLNEFLVALTRVKNASFHAVFFSERGEDKTRKISFIEEDGIDRVNKVNKALKYNWELNIQKPLEFAKQRSLKEAAKTGRKAGEKHKRIGEDWDWIISVSISVHGSMDLAKIKLPLAYDASVGGRLGNFVSWHNQRREWAADKETPARARDTRPTSEKLIDSFGAFGPQEPRTTAPATTRSRK